MITPLSPGCAPGPREPTVYVVDDDESIRELLLWLMKRNAIRAEAFSNAKSFLKAYRPGDPGCLVLDLYMPGMSGLDLQRYLTEAEIEMPVIFLSGQADVSKAVLAVKSGAADFIEKPFDYRRIVELVRECLQRDVEARDGREMSRQRATRLGTLTQREREVLDRVIAGKVNRLIAEEMAISIKTVEAHRARLMEKLAVDSVAELVRVTLGARSIDRTGGG
jgi:FixJ family two-component response regulator